MDFGLKLVEFCYNTYHEDATGIGPEDFSWLSTTVPNTTTIPANQTEFYDRAGFYITNPEYRKLHVYAIEHPY